MLCSLNTSLIFQISRWLSFLETFNVGTFFWCGREYFLKIVTEQGYYTKRWRTCSLLFCSLSRVFKHHSGSSLWLKIIFSQKSKPFGREADTSQADLKGHRFLNFPSGYNIVLWYSLFLNFLFYIGVSVSRLVVSNSLRPLGLGPTRFLCSWDSPGKNTGVGCHLPLQGIFPTQGMNLGLLHCKQILFSLSLI